MGDINLKKTLKLIQGLSKGEVGSEIEKSTFIGLRVVEARRGFLRFHYVVPNHLLDGDGNWQAGARATMIDNLGANAVFSIHGIAHVSVTFSVSYFSTVKYQEEVEIEAKAVAQRGGKLMYHEVEIKRKNNGELIAIGKQWMSLSRSRESKL